MNNRTQIISKFSIPQNLSYYELKPIILNELYSLQPISPTTFRNYLSSTFNIYPPNIRDAIASLHDEGYIIIDSNLHICLP